LGIRHGRINTRHEGRQNSTRRQDAVKSTSFHAWDPCARLTGPAPQLTTEQRDHLLMLGDDLERLWDHPGFPVTLKKRILRTVLEGVVANTTDDPPTLHLKLH
jgi:hypothetical protein